MTCAAPLLMAVLLSGAAFSAAQIHDNDPRQTLDILRVLSEKPWMALNRWDRLPRVMQQLGPNLARPMPRDPDENDFRNYDEDDVLRVNSDKRSAVATALNAGRRRRQPSPALGKAVTPYVGVGVLNDVGSFFDSLRDNLETLASLSPQQRSSLFQDPPTVVQVPSSDLTTADRTWRRTVRTRGLTNTTPGCCGPASDGRPIPPIAKHQALFLQPQQYALQRILNAPERTPDAKHNTFEQYSDAPEHFVYMPKYLKNIPDLTEPYDDFYPKRSMEDFSDDNYDNVNCLVDDKVDYYDGSRF